jgi:hypothetical protein
VFEVAIRVVSSWFAYIAQCVSLHGVVHASRAFRNDVALACNQGEADEWGTIALFSDSTISLFVSIEFVIEHYIRRLTMSTRGAECRLHRVELRHPRCRIPCRVFVFRELANDGNSYRLSWITHISTIREGSRKKFDLFQDQSTLLHLSFHSFSVNVSFLHVS